MGGATAEEIHQGGFLNANDPVAITFWIISIAMVAATVFFVCEANSLKMHWRTSCHVGSLVTLVAAVHYFYMREYWVIFQESPIVYRYIDWSITVPLQMVGSISSCTLWTSPSPVACSGDCSSAPSRCCASAIWARPASSTHGWASSLAWLAGVSSFTRSSWVKPDRHPSRLIRPTNTSSLPSTHAA